jgi:hypothetical protein
MTNVTSSRPAFGAYTPPTPTPSLRPAPRRRRVYPAWLAPLIVGAVVLAVGLATMSPWPVGVYYDDAIYLMLAKALATGEGYRYLNFPGHPAATHYPPGYPALLALFWKIAPTFPQNVAFFKLINPVLMSFAASGLFVFSRRELGIGTAMNACAMLFGFLMVPVLAVTGVLFSEPLFLVMLAVALPACERALREERTRSVVMAALLAAATTLVRSIGLPLVIALVVGLAARRRYRAASIAAAGAGALLLPWHLWTAVHNDKLPRVFAASYGSYSSAFGAALDRNGLEQMARVAAYNVRDLARPIGAVFAPGATVPTHWLVVATVVVMLGVGLWTLRRRAPVTALFILGYSAMVIVWPYAPDRFLWGVWPLLMVTIAVAADIGVRGARARRAGGLPLVAYAALVVAAGALVLGLARYNARGYQKSWWETSQRVLAGQVMPIAEWIEQNTRPTDIIASDGDPLLALYTGRLVIPSARWAVEAYPNVADSASRLTDLRELLAAYPVRYLILSNPKSHSAAGARVLSESPQPTLHMLTVLQGGAAVFTTAPGIKE